MRNGEVAREILEHGGAGRIDRVRGEESFVGLRLRLGLELGGDDVEYAVEMPVDGEPLHHLVGVLAGAVGQDQLAAPELLDRGPERRVGLERRMVDRMHELQEIVRMQSVLRHQPAQRGAIAPVIILLHPERLLGADLEKIADEIPDSCIDLLPQIQVMWVQRVVEIEHPGLDPSKSARGLRLSGSGHHALSVVGPARSHRGQAAALYGSWNRTIVPLPSILAKPVEARPLPRQSA